MAMITPGFETISKDEFDSLARQADLWENGPEIEQFGSGYGDPYNPKREVRGTLKDGRKIRTEV